MQNEKIKVCIVPPQKLPIPSVKGGAVESLIDLLIKENEIQKNLNITVISIFNKKAYRESKQYKYTKFIYIPYSEVFDKIFYKLKHFCKKFFNLSINLHFYTILYNILIALKNFDLILIESADPELSFVSRKNPKEKIVGHIHGEMIGNELMDKKFGHFIAISEYIKNKFLENSLIEDKRVFVLKNGIDINKMQSKLSKKEARAKLNLDNKDKIILYVGRIVKEKGIKELILAFDKIKIENKKLLIIGSSNFGKITKTTFEVEIENLLSQNKSIIHLGFIHNDQLFKYYKAADVVVMPSTCQEAAGLVAIESLASGTPLIATCSGGLPEYVSSEEAILLKINKNLVDNIAKSVTYLCSDEEQAKILSGKGKTKVKEYSQEKYYNNYYNILSKILKNNEERK